MKRWLFAGALFAGAVLFLALGVWQLQRLEWKRALIARVEQRVHAPAITAPDAAQFDALAHEYRPVRVTGRFLNDRETLVQAVTQLGGGYWVMTPFITDAGFTVLINRGFVDSTRRQSRSWSRVEGAMQITGLLRLDEPGGGFLRDNRPADDRWYSRDVDAIAAARSLRNVAPYFIDAGAEPGTTQEPVGGQTVVKFNNNHLQYALTWFALALLLAGGTVAVLRSRSISSIDRIENSD